MRIATGRTVSVCLTLVLMTSIVCQINVNPQSEMLFDSNGQRYTESNTTLDDAWLSLSLISWQGNTSTTWDTDGTDMDVQFQICIDLDGESDGISPQCTWTEVWNNTLNLSNAWETTFDLIEDNTTLNITIECWDNDDDSDEWNNGPDACDMNSDDDEWRLYYEVNWSTTATETFSGDGSLGNDTQWGNAESVWKVTVSYYGDEDNDGISDNLDKCQGTTREFRFDLNGCSWYQLDDDFDGTINDFDSCPSLAHESYCGTSGDYLQVFNIDFRQTNKDRLYGFENWDISPNGEHLAIALGMTFHAGSNCQGEESVSGLIVISLDDVADGHNFCDATGVQFNPYHYNSIFEPNPTSLKFSKTGHALYYKEDTFNFFAYNTSNWVEINEPHQSQTFSFTTNEGQTISRGSGGGFLISDINGEQISIQTRNQHPGVISIDGTDDSKSVLVASKDEEFSGNIYDNAINSTLSIYDLTTGQKKDVQLPSSLQENGEAYFLGVKISANGLRIIVHHASNYGEWFAVYERDRDADGLVDTEDLCPDENGEFSGCLEEFFDTDEDGVNDKEDQCPETLAGINVDSIGCAPNQIDSDGDGISDANDQCPNTPGGDSVGLTGCSGSQVDSDGDGVYDAEDNCPSTPGGTTVDTVGCAPNDVVDLDSDGDGVRDSVDVCPNSATGIIVDSEGCRVEVNTNDSVKDEASGESLFQGCIGIFCLGGIVVAIVSWTSDRQNTGSTIRVSPYNPTSQSTFTTESQRSLEQQKQVLREVERQKRQSENQVTDLKRQLAHSNEMSSTRLQALQRELKNLENQVRASEHAKNEMKEELESLKSQDRTTTNETSATIQDSAIAGDSLVGSTKIENQTNISNDVEAIAKAVIDAYLKGKGE